MSRSPARLAAVSLACLLLPAGIARADQITWFFAWSPTSQTLHADSGSGSITLSSFGGFIQSHPGDMVGLAAATVAFSPGSGTSHFDHTPFSLTLTLTDNKSLQSASQTFSGTFNGDLSSSSAPSVTLNSPTQGNYTLGSNPYNVSIGPYFTLTPQAGFLFAQVIAGSKAQTVPEPTALALAGLALPLLGLNAWRKRRRAATA
jgi:hypothetical protein